MAGLLDARPRVEYFYTGKSGTQLLTDSLKNIFVKDYQSIPVVVNENISVYDAIVLCFWKMLEHCLSWIKIHYPSWSLSSKDLLRASIGKQELSTIPVNIIMTRMPNITICEREDLLIDIAKKLIEKQIDAMTLW